jgi:uncharacterized Zn-binding protein involved in type VI secretion
MPGIARVGIDNVNGGEFLNGNSTVLCNGKPIATLESRISAHSCCGTGCIQHCAATMVSASKTVMVGGILVCRAGDVASCGDVATGSSNVLCG